jgi:SAM-dependent methyltransferase
MDIPTLVEIEDKLRGEDLNEWLDLWHAEQGPAKPGALKLIAAAIPFATEQDLKVIDVGCGPGDTGRMIHARFPHASVDFLDRNEFFVALCGAVNRRDGIGGRTWVRDLSEPDWRRGLDTNYDVAVAVNTVHWFSLEQAGKLLGEILQLLRPGGMFVLMEPAGVEPLFAPGFQAWQKEQPSQHRYDDWRRFWSRVKALLGYDYGFLGEPDDEGHMGDTLSVKQWIHLLTETGYGSVDILLRDSEKVVLASVRPGPRS